MLFLHITGELILMHVILMLTSYRKWLHTYVDLMSLDINIHFCFYGEKN